MGYSYLDILIAFITFISLLISHSLLNNKNGSPTNWPIIGMLPILLKHFHRINEACLEFLQNVHLTFLFKGPWFTNMNILLTANPSNVHHVMIKNFSNYLKGSKFNESLEIFGEGVLNSDSDMWLYHRKKGQAFMAQPRFHQFLLKKISEEVEGGLIPVLDHVSKQGLEVDLQDLFSRFTFDNICSMIMDYNPRSLSIDFPRVPPASKALDEAEEVILRRFVMPTCIWKLQRWLCVGLEKKHKEAWQTLDSFIYKCIARKREEMSKTQFEEKKHGNNEMGVDVLTYYMDNNGNDVTSGKKGDKFLRDTVLAYLIAGRDTTTTGLSWFFYLLSKNPVVVTKIREELDATMAQNENYNKEGIDKLVYLHGALCEALRLYPPVVFEVKVPKEADVLPTGHQVDPNMQIIFHMYAMARMKSIWGDDCYEFKPERWISEIGHIKHEPAYKFFVFNAGPRTCLGKQMALTQMKVVAATIIRKYNIQPIEGHPVVPALSIILRMKYGFKVKVFSSK